jgi:hypothetical protein
MEIDSGDLRKIDGVDDMQTDMEVVFEVLESRLEGG